MKLRKSIAFLMILALLAACLPASADTIDFPFLPGLSWNASVSDLENMTGVSGKESSDGIGNSGRMVFFEVKSPGLAPVPYELAVTLSSGGDLSMAIFLYDVSSAADKDTARGQIVDEMDKLYGERSTVLFDSPESMQTAFDGATGLSDAMASTALGGLSGAARNMFKDLSAVSVSKGWLVDRKYAAMVIYSTSGSMSGKVAVALVDLEQTITMMSDASLPEGRTGWLDLPAGLAWKCSRAELESALGQAGLEYADQEGNLYAYMAGPTGSLMMTLYLFDGNDQLMGSLHIAGLDYDTLEAAIVREFGNKATIDEEQIKQQIQNSLGMSASRMCAWINTESLVYLFSTDNGTFIMQISTKMVMEQQ